MPPVQQNLFNRICHQSCKRLPLRAARFGHVFWGFCLLIFLNMQTCSGEVDQSSYVETKEGQRLDGDVSKYVHARSRLDCISQCVLQDESCRSVNFKKNSVSKEIENCELLSTVDSEEPTERLRKDKDVDYYKLLDRKPPDPVTSSTPPIQELLSSCKELLERNISLPNGGYKLKNNESLEEYNVYCHMTEIPECGAGGWTLVIKIDGSMTEFNYSSPYWTNKETYAVEDGLEGLTEKQTKLASYWNTAFNKICLGMKVNDDTKCIAIDHQASSLHNVIASESFTTLSAGRDKWKSLITGSALQDNCNKAGFNFKKEWSHFTYENQYMKVRIGIVANNQHDCETCNTCIGFGTSVRGCHGDVRNTTCGNIGTCNWFGNRDTAAFGYILVQ